MTSISEYVASCNKEQLETLVEEASRALKKKQREDYVPLWVIVDDGFINEKAFLITQYEEAVDHLCSLIRSRQGNDSDVKLTLEKTKFRESEVERMLAL